MAYEPISSNYVCLYWIITLFISWQTFKMRCLSYQRNKGKNPSLGLSQQPEVQNHGCKAFQKMEVSLNPEAI